MTKIDKIEELIQQELKEANETYPAFASDHEAYAVILEELEEMQEEATACFMMMGKFWHNVRADESIKQQADALKQNAIFVIQEAIQLAAMAEKALNKSK